jgi:hypothetical protein
MVNWGKQGKGGLGSGEGYKAVRQVRRDVANYVNLFGESEFVPARSCGSLGRERDLVDVRFPDGTVIRALSL